MHPRDTPCTGLLVAPGARSGRSSRFVFTVSDHPAELLLIVIGEPEDALKIPFILVSGFMLFSSEAMKCYASVPFQVKMLFLFTAMIYHFTIYRRVTNTDREPKPAWGATVAVISVVLWLGVGLAGRGIGFL